MEVDRQLVVEAAQRLVEQERYEQALVQYRKLADADPADGRALLKLAELHGKLAQYAEAASVFTQVGDVYAARGEPHKALAAYARVRDLVVHHAPQLEDLYRHAALSSVDLYEQLDLRIDGVAVLGDLATRLEGGGHLHAALPFRRRAAALAPDDVRTRVRLAMALLRADEVDEAVQLVRESASQLVAADRWDDALTLLERLLQRVVDPACARMAAELYLARDTRPDAVRALTKLQAWVRAEPRHLEALNLVAHALTRVGHHEQAAQVRREMDAIAAEQGRPAPDSARSPLPTLTAPLPEAESPIRVIAVSDASWREIASRLQRVTGEPGKDEEIVAFVREGDSSRDTMRALYGVVKFFLT